jgi:ribbon-helix-helix protein, copG family
MSQINFNLRISEKLNEELIRIAEEQGRSKNKQIEQILKEYVEKYNEEEEEKAKRKDIA